MNTDKNKAASLGTLGSAYPHRLYALADAVRANCDHLFLEVPAPEPGKGYLRIDPALMALIESVLVSAANIKKLIYPPKERGAKESPGAFRIRQARVKFLGDLIEGLDTTAIRGTQARNALGLRPRERYDICVTRA